MTQTEKEFLHEFLEDMPLLLEAGFIAIKQVDEDSAKKLFCSGLVINPEETLSAIGMGMVHLYKLELDEACKLFKAVLDKEPKNQMANAFLGIANLFMLNEDGLKEGGDIIKGVLNTVKDPQLKLLAENTIKLKEEISGKVKDLHPLEKGQTKSPLDRLKR